MLEWKFDHLANFLQLLADATDVLVGDARDLGILVLVDRFFLDDDLSVGQDLDDSLWARLNNLERQSLCEQGHARNEDAITRGDRSLVEATPREALDSRPEADLLLLGHNWAENEARALLRLDLANRDTISKGYTRIFANDSVYSNHSEVRILWATSPDDCSGGTLAFNLDNVARLEIQLIVERYPSSSMTDIARDGFRNPELQFLVRFVCHNSPPCNLLSSSGVVKPTNRAGSIRRISLSELGCVMRWFLDMHASRAQYDPCS